MAAATTRGVKEAAARIAGALLALALAPALAAAPAAAEEPNFEIPQAERPGGLALPITDPLPGDTPLPDRGVTPPRPVPVRVHDAPVVNTGPISAGVDAESRTPGLFATLGDGPLRSRADVTKDVTRLDAPAAASLGATVAPPLGVPFDLQFGPRLDWTLPDPLAPGSAANTAPRKRFDVETGVDVLDGLSVNARTEYGFEALKSPAEGARSPTNAEIMMRYRLAW